MAIPLMSCSPNVLNTIVYCGGKVGRGGGSGFLKRFIVNKRSAIYLRTFKLN